MTIPTTFREVANLMEAGFARVGRQGTGQLFGINKYDVTHDGYLQPPTLPGEVCALGALCLGVDKHSWKEYFETSRSDDYNYNMTKEKRQERDDINIYYWPKGGPPAYRADVYCPMINEETHEESSCYAVNNNDIEDDHIHKRNIPNTIIHLNDEHKWPIADIAAWVSSLDEPLAA